MAGNRPFMNIMYVNKSDKNDKGQLAVVWKSDRIEGSYNVRFESKLTPAKTIAKIIANADDYWFNGWESGPAKRQRDQAEEPEDSYEETLDDAEF